jgi:hypothetical protein
MELPGLTGAWYEEDAIGSYTLYSNKRGYTTTYLTSSVAVCHCSCYPRGLASRVTSMNRPWTST